MEPMELAPAVDAAAGFPWGWFVVAFSDELGADRAWPLRYFGRDLVAFRDGDGRAAVLDAHCPHRGAHLGIGGSVVDGRVRCPLHGWRFGGDGRCHLAPHNDPPPDVALRVWPVCEQNGAVHVWFHPEGAPPRFEVPAIPEWRADGWSSWRHRTLEVRTHSREIVENVVDIAHFVPVHATEAQRFENQFDGHRAIQRSGGVGAGDSLYPGSTYRVEATYHGPGLQITEFESRGVESRLLNAHTMIDADRLHLRIAVMVKSAGSSARSERFLDAYVRDLQTGFEQDIAIWTHKRWRDRPVLCDGDGPIMRLRRWYAQFHA
jgi:3-ketosteroid 9alpha-monooxygenase subunit A